jgi:hypothetical protein
MAVSFTVHHTCGAVVRIQTQDALRGPICPKCKKSVKVPLWQKVSARLRGARSLTGCLYLLARLVGFCFACVIMIVGWPASGWLASGVALTACLKRRPNKWTKSAVKSLEPFVWATAVLTGLQCALGPSPVEEHLKAITDAERFIVRASLVVPSWTKLGWKEFVLVSGILALVSLAAPHAALVTRFLRGSKIVSRVGTTITALASFTFFGGVIYQSDLDQVYKKIQLQLRDTRTKITEETVRLVAVKATTIAVKDLDDEKRSCLAMLFNLVGTTTSQRAAASAVTLALVEKDFASEPEFSFPDAATARLHTAVAAEAGDPFFELDRDKAHLDALTKVETEAEKGLKKILEKAVNAIPDSMKEIAGDYVGSLLHIESDLLFKQVRKYLEHVGDAYFEKISGSILDRAARYIKEKFTRMTREHVSSEIFETELEIKSASIQKALASARLAQDEASRLANSSSEDLNQIRDKIEKNARAAASHAEFANSIGPQAISLPRGTVVDMTAALKAAHDAKVAVESARLALEAARKASERALAARAAARAAKSNEGILRRLIRVFPK